MIDDAKVRLQILKNIPTLEPWRVEMEEIDFGDVLGCTVKTEGGFRRVTTPTRSKEHAQKSEGRIAFELSQQIKAVLASTPDAPLTTNVRGKIIRVEDGGRGTSGA